MESSLSSLPVENSSFLSLTREIKRKKEIDAETQKKLNKKTKMEKKVSKRNRTPRRKRGNSVSIN